MAKTSKLQSIYDREGRNTSSSDPVLLNSRVFIGNLPSEKISRQEVEELFLKFGNVLGVSLHKSYGFVQYDKEDDAKKAVESMNGYLLQGMCLDVHLAIERRRPKDGDLDRGHHRSRHDDYRHRDRDRDRDRDRERERRRGRSRSPPYLPPELEYRARMRHLERMHMLPPLRDPYFDPMFPPPHPRDFMRPPRDDPYDHPRDRYPPPPPPMRMRDPYGPPEPYDRMGPPLRERERPLPPPRPPTPPSLPPERRAGGGGGGGGDRPTDMEIIVVNRQQKEYADRIRSRVEYHGLVVDMIQLSPTVSLADALDAAASRGLLYAIIVTSQHELHQSVTLTILHGRNPQEHKNMPLEDALGLVDRDYERYTINVREGRIPPRRSVPQKNEVTTLLSQAASGEQLSPDQLQRVIEALQKQKNTNESPVSQLPQKEDIQRQQADLQAKILSLLGSSAVVPSSSTLPPRGGGGGGVVGGSGGGGGGYNDGIGTGRGGMGGMGGMGVGVGGGGYGGGGRSGGYEGGGGSRGYGAQGGYGY